MAWKVDLAMWAKNGAKYLPIVLERIEQVIPEEAIVNRIFVDDKSTDDTVKIAKEFNWSIYANREGFVDGGVREAFRHVESPFFVSVEQDILLAKNWWDIISNYMEDKMLVTAQGIRIDTNPVLRKLAEYQLKKNPANFISSNKSFDNNIFQTKLVKKLGGFHFSRRVPYSPDSEFRDIVDQSEYRWVVDGRAVSLHIKESIFDHYICQIKWATEKRRLYMDSDPLWKMCFRIFKSLGDSLKCAYRTRYPQMVYCLPLINLAVMKLYLVRRKFLATFKGHISI